MRIAIVGQQAFGKAALDAFLERGDDVAGVFAAPEAPGARPDPLRQGAAERGLKTFQFKSLGSARGARSAARSSTSSSASWPMSRNSRRKPS